MNDLDLAEATAPSAEYARTVPTDPMGVTTGGEPVAGLAGAGSTVSDAFSLKILPALPVLLALLSLLACGRAAATAVPFPGATPAATPTPTLGPISGPPESTPVIVGLRSSR